MLPSVLVYNYNNTPYADLTGYVFGKMVFNDYESDMYITTDSTSVKNRWF
jgi:hypothetical protein